MVHLKPTRTELTSKDIACLLKDTVFHHYSFSYKIIHNHEPQFIFKFIKDLYQLLEIKDNSSTVYHPQSDRQTEYIN